MNYNLCNRNYFSTKLKVKYQYSCKITSLQNKVKNKQYNQKIMKSYYNNKVKKFKNLIFNNKIQRFNSNKQIKLNKNQVN